MTGFLKETNIFASAYYLWVIGAIALFFCCRFILPIFTRRTRITYDDLILATFTWAVPLAVLISGFWYAAQKTSPDSKFAILTAKGSLLLLVSIGIWFFWRVALQLIEGSVGRHAEETDTPLDDILVPLVKRAAPIFLAIANLFVLVWIFFGSDGLQTFLAVIGGLSFLLIFLFRDPLENLFGGIYLLLDAPFRYGDLVILENDKTYRIDLIGTRVTLLYDVKQNTSEYVPNFALANQRITNITRPNPELRTRVSIGVGYESDLEAVSTILTSVANAHPNILGELDSKLGAIHEHATQLSSEAERGFLMLQMDRLRIEHRLRQQAEFITRMIATLASAVQTLELGGLNGGERTSILDGIERIERAFDGLRDELTVWFAYHTLIERLQDRKLTTEEVAACTRQLQAATAVVSREDLDKTAGKWALLRIASEDDLETEYRTGGLVHSLAGVDSELASDERVTNWIAEQQSTLIYSEQMEFYLDWARAIQRVVTDLGQCKRILRRRMHYSEFTLHNRLLQLHKRFNARFMLAIDVQRQPQFSIVSLGDSAINIELEFYVDNLRAEHFERVDRVTSEVYEAAVQRLTEANIELPFKQVDLRVKELPAAT